MGSEPGTAAATVAGETRSLTLREKLAYGSGSFGEQMIFNPATMFIVFFYTDVVGIAAATVGTLLVFSRVFDLINPLMGMVVDRTKSRFGKGRPWLLWLAVPFGIAAVLLFSTPNLGPTGKLIYAFITYNLALTIMVALVDIPYTAMLPLITSDQHQRTLLSLFRMVFNTAGGMASFALTLPMVKLFGGGAQGWQRAFVIYGAVGTTLLFICFSGTKERVVPASQQTAKVSTRQSIAALFGNKYWVLMACLAVALFVMLGFLGSDIYYCRYVLGNVELFGPLMTVFQLSILVGMLMIGPILKRFGKRRSALGGLAIAVLGLSLIFVSPGSYTVVLIGSVIRGLGYAPLVGTMFAMVADTIEYGEWKFGIRTEGLTFGGIALATKAIGLGNAAIGFILGRTGYVAGAVTQSASALRAIKLMFLQIPLVLTLIIALIIWLNGLDKQYPTIRAELDRRRAEAT